MKVIRNTKGKPVASYGRNDAWQALKQIQLAGSLDDVIFNDNDETGELESVEIEVSQDQLMELVFSLSERLEETKAPVQYGYGANRPTAGSSSGKGKTMYSEEGQEQQKQYLRLSNKVKQLALNNQLDQFNLEQDDYDFLKKLFAKELEYKVRGRQSEFLLDAIDKYENEHKGKAPAKAEKGDKKEEDLLEAKS